MSKVLLVLAAAVLGGCAAPAGGNPGQRCGALGCISSPHLQARLDHSVVGQRVDDVVRTVGAPDNSYAGQGTQTLTWQRTQTDRTVGTFSCSETVVAKDGVVTDYSRFGNC